MTVLEREEVGHALTRWGATRFFTPLGMNVPAGFRELLGGGLPADDVLLTRAFTGLETNMLRPSIRAAGLDPMLPDVWVLLGRALERAQVFYARCRDDEAAVALALVRCRRGDCRKVAAGGRRGCSCREESPDLRGRVYRSGLRPAPRGTPGNLPAGRSTG